MLGTWRREGWKNEQNGCIDLEEVQTKSPPERERETGGVGVGVGWCKWLGGLALASALQCGVTEKAKGVQWVKLSVACTPLAQEPAGLRLGISQD